MLWSPTLQAPRSLPGLRAMVGHGIGHHLGMTKGQPAPGTSVWPKTCLQELRLQESSTCPMGLHLPSGFKATVIQNVKMATRGIQPKRRALLGVGPGDSTVRTACQLPLLPSASGLREGPSIPDQCHFLWEVLPVPTSPHPP